MIRKIQPLSEASAQVSYLEAGAGTPLVLIHGVGMNAEAWFPQIAVLSRHFRVIAVDMPGHGDSTGFGHHATLTDYVSWLAAFLATQPEQRFAVAGHSMGALITAGLAIDYPHSVSRAIVMSGVFRRSAAARAAVLQRAHELASGDVQLDAPLERWFSATPEEQPLRHKVGEWLQQVSPAGYARAYQAFAEGDSLYADRWAEMRCPVLVMTGELDANSSPEMTRQMAGAAPYGEAVVIDNARHMLNLTDAERVTQEMLSFLEPVAAPVTSQEPIQE
ncbi:MULTISPECIES: alpha/beta fold hydrolase [Pantoea]|jgi:pimeloyl-ACP methyl ester carboxylesterase|uniref:alpha/beta fold hydrolase n=1 Tax=Pantoea TaxID=53335 RepID=UPI000A221532|nr:MULTISPECIES: alpha/beta hydrolase [Pantoea]KAA6044304.1 alpha/beta hydrolase [Pantoea sp. Bo_7]KAA6090081.1 alpha/beta hydrolase [Pantoea sp. Bo_10]MCL9648698.1 alpha/beta hydrolase [Pantoea eucrina]MDJ0023475.1 alpha/beta hydrolase [Pantoea eucrina]ORM77102.1 alpha/beta hydrolase [Pantoea eucrina]